MDAGGTWYRQESFAVRGLGTGDLVSFVRLTADARHGKGGVLRLVPEGSRRGARVAQGTMSVQVAPGERDDAVRRLARAVRRRARSRSSSRRTTPPAPRLVDFWLARLGERRSSTCPEKVVNDAQRSLLIQDLALTWRYSVGNQYEEFSFAEALDAAEVMAEYGLPGVTQRDPAQLARRA